MKYLAPKHQWLCSYHLTIEGDAKLEVVPVRQCLIPSWMAAISDASADASTTYGKAGTMHGAMPIILNRAARSGRDVLVSDQVTQSMAAKSAWPLATASIEAK